MEAREELEECEDQGVLHQLVERNRSAQAQVLSRLSTAFRGALKVEGRTLSGPHHPEGGSGSDSADGQGLGGTGTPEDGSAARRCVVELTYLSKLEEEIIKKLEHL